MGLNPARSAGACVIVALPAVRRSTWVGPALAHEPQELSALELAQVEGDAPLVTAFSKEGERSAFRSLITPCLQNARQPLSDRLQRLHGATVQGQRRLASSYTFVNPVIAMLLLGVALVGETVTFFEWMAAGVVLVGLVLLLLNKVRQLDLTASRPCLVHAGIDGCLTRQQESQPR